MFMKAYPGIVIKRRAWLKVSKLKLSARTYLFMYLVSTYYLSTYQIMKLANVFGTGIFG